MYHAQERRWQKGVISKRRALEYGSGWPDALGWKAKWTEGRAKKLGPLLETMQRGTSDDGYIAARGLLVNVAVVVVLMALAHSEESGEDDDDQDEEEDGDAVEDAQDGSAAQRDGFGD